MYRNIWESCHKSVCSICFFTESGIKVNTLTGFRIEDFIVTDESIYKAKSCHEVVIQFFENTGYEVSHSIKIPYSDLTARLNRVAEFEKEGYALIHTDGLVLDQVPTLVPEFRVSNQIGTSIAVIGFHEDQNNMSLKLGTVSSFIKTDNGKRYIQIEAAIKQGNSGSPVINVETGRVIGVIGYRLSILADAYEAFKAIIDENLKVLRKSVGMMNIMDIDPIQVLIANQNQLKQMSKEFYKSAVMSYGFAHEIFTFRNYLTEKAEIRKVSQNA